MSKYLPDHIIKEEGADEPAKKKAKGEKKPRAEAKTDNMPYLSTELQKGSISIVLIVLVNIMTFPAIFERRSLFNHFILHPISPQFVE